MFAIIVCVGFICCEIAAVNSVNKNAKTNANRLQFIKDLGYTVVSNQPITKTVNIPETFYGEYENYNDLQKSASYDLALYKGCEVTIYTYYINAPQNYDGEWAVNLIVYNDRIIGGDISSTTLGGFILPLKKQSE